MRGEKSPYAPSTASRASGQLVRPFDLSIPSGRGYQLILGDYSKLQVP